MQRSRSSKYRGVSWDKGGKKWRVRIKVGSKEKSLGSFSDEIAAACAYDAFVIAKKLNKPLNFPGGVAAKGHVVTSPKTSRFRGVSWDKRVKKWEVRIGVHGNQKRIGHFTDEGEAAHAYDAYAIVNRIETPRNFPDENEDAVVAEAERGRAAKKQKKAASKSSTYQGVGWKRAVKKWQVRIRVDGKQKSIGLFADEAEAAHAYDAYAIANGIDTPRNFPDEDEDDVVAEAARVRAAPKKRKKAANATSTYQGVSWDKTNEKWVVNIRVGGKQKYVGRYAGEIEAAHAYDAYAITNDIDTPRNFPVALDSRSAVTLLLGMSGPRSNGRGGNGKRKRGGSGIHSSIVQMMLHLRF